MSKRSDIQRAYADLENLARKRYGISGSTLLAKLEKGESGGKGNAKSVAGAKGWYQFMPGTRQAVLQKYGIDPWRSEREARDAAVLHLTGRLGHAKGLEGYNPGGGQQYVRYILDQKAGGGGPTKGGTQYGVRTTTRTKAGKPEDVEGAILDTLLEGTKPQKVGATVLQKLAYDPKYAAKAGKKETGYEVTRRGGKTGSTPTHQPARGEGVVMFDGKPVAGWIAAELRWARKQGWKGTVTSGFRTRADQERIYNSGVRPAAKPGTSNHEATEFPRGAVDVSDAATLAKLLRRRGSPLIWAGAKDPVHFSHPHGGSY